MTNGSGSPAQVPVQQPPQPKRGRLGRAWDWMAVKLAGKPEILAEGYNPDKATKGLDQFVRRVRDSLRTMDDRQRLGAMLEIYRVLSPAESKIRLEEEVRRPLFNLLAKMYSTGRTGEMLERATERNLVAMRRLIFQIAEETAVAERQGRSGAEVLRVLGRASYDMSDGMRVAAILAHSYERPFDQGVEMLARQLGVKFPDTEKIGFLIEAKNRGLYVKPSHEDMVKAQKWFDLRLRMASGGMSLTTEEKAVRAAFMDLLRNAVQKGEHASLDDAIAAVLKSGDFSEAFVRIHGGEGIAAAEKARRAMLEAALNKLKEGMDAAAQLGHKDAHSQMYWLIKTRTSRESFWSKNDALLDQARTEIDALYKYVDRLSTDKPAIKAFGSYTLLAKQAAIEEERLQELAGGRLRGLKLIISRRMRDKLPAMRAVLKHAAPWVPATVARELGEAMGKAPGTRWGAFWEVKPIRRLGLWTAIYVGGIWLVSYGFKKRRDSLERALAERKTELTEHLGKLSRSDLKFFRDNMDAFVVFRALYAGAKVPLPMHEKDLGDTFSQKAGPVINPAKIAEFAPVYRQMWESTVALFDSALLVCKEALSKGTKSEKDAARAALVKAFGRTFVAEVEKAGFDSDRAKQALWWNPKKKFAEPNWWDPMGQVGMHIDAWSDPRVAYMRPGTGTNGGHLIAQFSDYYQLNPQLHKFLADNPEIYRMVVMGLGEGVVAASNVPSLLWYLQKNASYTTFEARSFMNERSKLFSMLGSADFGKILEDCKTQLGKGEEKKKPEEVKANREALVSRYGRVFVEEAEKNNFDEAKTREGMRASARAASSFQPELAILVGNANAAGRTLYNAPVAKDSIVRHVELWAIGRAGERKKLYALMDLYNSNEDARERLNSFIIPAGNTVYGNPVDLALRVARGELATAEVRRLMPSIAAEEDTAAREKMRAQARAAEMADAKKRGYIAETRFAEAGITKPETVAFIRDNGLLDWFAKNEKLLANAQPIFDRVQIRLAGTTERVPSGGRLAKFISDQLPDFENKSWFRGEAPRMPIPKPGGGVVPLEPLAILSAPKVPVARKEAGPPILGEANLRRVVLAVLYPKPKARTPEARRFADAVTDRLVERIRRNSEDDRALLGLANVKVTERTEKKIEIEWPAPRTKAYRKFAELVVATGEEIKGEGR